MSEYKETDREMRRRELERKDERSQTSLKNEYWQQKCNNWTASALIISFETINDTRENMKPLCEWNIQLSKHMWQCVIHYRLTGIMLDTSNIWVYLQADTAFQELVVSPSSCDWFSLCWHTTCLKIFFKIAIFSDVMPSSLIDVNRCFDGNVLPSYSDEGSKILRNVGKHVQNYPASYSRRP